MIMMQVALRAGCTGPCTVPLVGLSVTRFTTLHSHRAVPSNSVIWLV